MIVLASGSRSMTSAHRWIVYAELMQIQEEHPGEVMTLVHGGARGADTIAGDVADRLGWRVIVENADWDFGKPGGRDRNQMMIAKWQPRLAVFFHHSPLLGTGTHDCYTRCKLAGIPTRTRIYRRSTLSFNHG